MKLTKKLVNGVMMSLFIIVTKLDRWLQKDEMQVEKTGNSRSLETWVRCQRCRQKFMRIGSSNSKCYECRKRVK